MSATTRLAEATNDNAARSDHHDERVKSADDRGPMLTFRRNSAGVWQDEPEAGDRRS